MEGHVSAPIFGTPAWHAQREVELFARLARQPRAVVQLWLRKVRIQSIANAQRHAGKQAMGSQAAAPQVAGGEARPKTAAQIERRRRSDRKLRGKHLARKAWAAVRVGLALRRWWHRARAECAKRPATGSSSSTATPAPPPAAPPPPSPAPAPTPAPAPPTEASSASGQEQGDRQQGGSSNGRSDEPMLPPSAPASAAKRPTPEAPTAIPAASDGGTSAKKTVRPEPFDWLSSHQRQTDRTPRHYTKWSFDIRAPPKCRLCSQRSERGFSLVSLTGSTWRREDVVLLEPFWDACDAGACQLAWFRSNASNLAAHPVISPGPSFPSA